MSNVVQIRDYKTREERRQERLVRLAKETMGLIPSEMPEVQPNYRAPDKDPA